MKGSGRAGEQASRKSRFVKKTNNKKKKQRSSRYLWAAHISRQTVATQDAAWAKMQLAGLSETQPDLLKKYFFVLGMYNFCLSLSSSGRLPKFNSVKKCFRHHQQASIRGSRASSAGGVGLPSLFNRSTVWQPRISFVEQRKRHRTRLFKEPRQHRIASCTFISSCPLTPYLRGHRSFQVTTIFHASDMKVVFPALHSQRVLPRPLHTHTQACTHN